MTEISLFYNIQLSSFFTGYYPQTSQTVVVNAPTGNQGELALKKI